MARPLTGTALLSGLVGACALTVLHEGARRLVPKAPRMDLLGMRALARALRAADQSVPDDNTLHALALLGDLAGNAVYYSFVAAPTPAASWRRAALLGLAAGVGGVLLPPKLGLRGKPSGRSRATQAMTVGLYLAGGLVAAAAYRALEPPRTRPTR